MRKLQAKIISLAGISLFISGLYLIYEIFRVVKIANSQPNPPINVMLFENIPYCNCDVSAGLAWNIVAVVITFGVIMTVAGIAKYNLITRYA